MDELIQSGSHCDCCPGPRRRIFKSGVVEDGLDVRVRRWRWLNKQFPRMMKLERDKVAAWCARTGRDDDWWRDAMMEKHSPR